jgi:V/A-type H+-transporting ATPase subunit D
MRTIARLSSTRMNLMRAARRLERVQKGIALLRRKREALVLEFFRRARQAAEARTRIASRSRRAYASLARVLALHGEAGTRALGWPSREIPIELRPSQVWGIPVPDIVETPVFRRSLDARGTAPGSTGPAATGAASEFESLLTLLLEAAREDVVLRRLSDELARTSRQLNTLQHRLAPAIRRQVLAIRQVLEEREREERLRARYLSR